MEENISRGELFEIYKELYLKRNNSEKFIDFEILVQTYKMYLSAFFNVDCFLYGDTEFLFFAIDGFNYIYKSIFDDEIVDSDIIPLTLCDHDSDLRYRSLDLEETNYTDSDVILVYSLKLVMLFKDMDLIIKFYDKIQKLFFNSYVIESKEKGCGKDGMEIRKYYN